MHSCDFISDVCECVRVCVEFLLQECVWVCCCCELSLVCSAFTNAPTVRALSHTLLLFPQWMAHGHKAICTKFHSQSGVIFHPALVVVIINVEKCFSHFVFFGLSGVLNTTVSLCARPWPAYFTSWWISLFPYIWLHPTQLVPCQNRVCLQLPWGSVSHFGGVCCLCHGVIEALIGHLHPVCSQHLNGAFWLGTS